MSLLDFAPRAILIQCDFMQNKNITVVKYI